jgi:hypothetical protein
MLAAISNSESADLSRQLARAGWALVEAPIAYEAFRCLARGLGSIVQDEVIALRPGAHAYVAKPGPVPFHTDQAEVETIGWWCQRQDAKDGASRLLDSRPILARMGPQTCGELEKIHLACPPLSGGPPTLSFPILRQEHGRSRFFCSPWLKPVSGDATQLEILRQLKAEVGRAALQEVIELRLRPGQALFIDNQRMFHGRGAISPDSRRSLCRVWMMR